MLKVEAKRKNNTVSQCHRCQKFGHAAKCCKAQWRCVKCGENHPTASCQRVKGKDTAKCANCGEEHTANYRGCKNFPKLPKSSAANSQDRNQRTKPNPSASVLVPGRSYATTTSAKPNTTNANNAPAPARGIENPRTEVKEPRTTNAGTQPQSSAQTNTDNVMAFACSLLTSIASANNKAESMAMVLKSLPDLYAILNGGK